MASPCWLLLVPAVLATEVVQNGGFEQGLEHWEKRGCQLSAEQWDVQDGEQSCYVSDRQATWAGPEQVLDTALLRGRSTAELSYAIKLHSGRSLDYSWTLQLRSRTGDLSYYHLADRAVAAGQGWMQVATTVNLPQLDGIEEVRLYLEGSPAGAESLLDSVSLVVGGGPGPGPDPGNWQEQANERIREHRMAELTVTVEGTDLSGLTLELTQLRHSFPFGTALKGSLIKQCVDKGEDDAYCTFAKENFNYVVLANAMKWQDVEQEQGQFRYGPADATLSWAAERGMRARGHTLFKAVPNRKTPAWVEALAGAEMVEAVEQHIENMLTHFSGKVEAWDVNNEMMHGVFFTEASGDPDIRRKMFEWAHDRDPELRLFVNDYNIVSGNEVVKYVKHIQELLEQGAPVSGIGVQGHFGETTIDIAKVQGVVKDLAAFGLPIWVTEFDWSGSSKDHTEHARQLENFYRLMFSLPAVEGVIMWGFWDQAHWRPQAAITNGALVERNAAGRAYSRLVHEEWSSSTLRQVEGPWQERVFKGDYRARLLRGADVLVTEEFTVRGDTAITLRLVSSV